MASPTEIIDLHNFAENLQTRDGIWFSTDRASISYPAEDNAKCFQIEDNSFWFRHRNRCITSLVKRFCNNEVFFDIGGGNGFVAKGLQDAGIPTVLVEPGIEGVKNAGKRGLENLVCSTLEDAGFKAQGLPAIGVFDVVEHIENDIAFIKNMHHYLRPGGKLFLTVPAYNFLWTNEDDFAGHFRRYTLGGLVRQLEQHGYKVEYASYLFSPLVVPIFLFRSLPSKLGFNKNMDDIDKFRNEHGNNKGFLTAIITKVLQLEYQRVSKLRTIPFGSSCIVVASKK